MQPGDPKPSLLGTECLADGCFSEIQLLPFRGPFTWYWGGREPGLSFGKLTEVFSLLYCAPPGELSACLHPVWKGSALGGCPQTPWGSPCLSYCDPGGEHAALNSPLSHGLRSRQQKCLLKEVSGQFPCRAAGNWREPPATCRGMTEAVSGCTLHALLGPWDRP